MEREPNTEYVLSCSYGKDSIACLGAIEKLGLPLDRIVHAEVWATDTIPADLPPMVEFKAKADEIIYKRYGIKVEHIWATQKLGGGYNKLFYEYLFYTTTNTERHGVHRYGFPCQVKPWCNSKLKVDLLTETNLRKHFLSRTQNCEDFQDIRLSDNECELVYERTQNMCAECV